MQFDGSDMMFAKYCSDAETEIVESERKVFADQVRREKVLHRRQLTKRWLLLVIVGAFACFLYFRVEIGELAGTVSVRGPDPTLVAQPNTKAKMQRKMSEMNKQNQDDLNEIMDH